METAKREQFRLNVIQYVDFLLKTCSELAITANGATAYFTPEMSDQEYLESIPGLWESILQSQRDYHSGKDKGTPMRGRTLEQFIAEECDDV